MNACIQMELQAHCRVAAQVAATMEAQIEAACDLAIRTLEQGKKILLFGNGGSAADAQHIAAEFTGRFRRDRRGLPAIALSTDTSALTSIGNDYGFERIFSRQVEALAAAGDLLIGFSTSGESRNIIAAFEQGRALGCATLGFTGHSGGAMCNLCDVCLVVPSDDTARIQEMHILLGHTLCQITETAICAAPPMKTVNRAA